MKIASPIIISVVLAAATLFAQSPSGGNSATKTLTGQVTDSMCGATHMDKSKTPAECTRTCVQQGQKYALVVGKKVYTLEGHDSELDKLAGQRVTVAGKLNGD